MRDFEAEAASPETPPTELWLLALRYPLQVLKNPALELLALEDPAMFQKVVFRAKAELAVRRLNAVAVARPVEERCEVLRALLLAEAPQIESAALRALVVGEVAPLLAAASRRGETAHRGRALNARGTEGTIRLKQKLNLVDDNLGHAATAALDVLLNTDPDPASRRALDYLRATEDVRAYLAGAPVDEARLAAARAQLAAFGEKP